MVYPRLYLKCKTKITLNERFSRLAEERDAKKNYVKNPNNTFKEDTNNKDRKFNENINRQKSKDLIHKDYNRKSRTFYNRQQNNKPKFNNELKSESLNFNVETNQQPNEVNPNNSNYSNSFHKQKNQYNNDNTNDNLTRRQVYPYNYQASGFYPRYRRPYFRIPRYNNKRFQNQYRKDISFYENDNYFYD